MYTKCMWTWFKYKDNPEDPYWTQMFIDKANQMAAEGKTANPTPTVFASQDLQLVCVYRTWVNLAAAEEWRDFCAEQVPVSFDIVDAPLPNPPPWPF